MSQTNLTVRTATRADASSLLSLIGSAYRGDESRKGWTTEADLLTGKRIDEAGLLDKIAEPHGAVLLATDAAGTLVACCELAKRHDGVASFGLFAVDPARQGAGFGRQILASAESYARETLGVVRLELSVIWPRAELIAWYGRRGYTLTGRQRPFPYNDLHAGAAALRDDLYFEILAKDLVAGKELGSAG